MTLVCDDVLTPPATAKFDKDASRYHPSVYSRKRVDLVASLHAAMSPLVLGQLKNLHKLAVSAFRKGLLNRLKGDNYDFGKVVVEVAQQEEDRFVANAQGESAPSRRRTSCTDTVSADLILKDTDWQYDDELSLLKDDLQLIADQLRADETRKMVNSIERSVKRQMADPIEVILSKPKADMWDTLLISYKETIDKAEETYGAKAKSGSSCHVLSLPQLTPMAAVQAITAPTRKMSSRLAFSSTALGATSGQRSTSNCPTLPSWPSCERISRTNSATMQPASRGSGSQRMTLTAPSWRPSRTWVLTSNVSWVSSDLGSG